MMPTYPPGTLHCGTINPIWLNGKCSVGISGMENTLSACLVALHGYHERSFQPHILIRRKKDQSKQTAPWRKTKYN